MKRPEHCCEITTDEHAVSMLINGQACNVDLCIAPIVAALNAGGVRTLSSCCGHGGQKIGDAVLVGSISLADGTELIVYPPTRAGDM